MYILILKDEGKDFMANLAANSELTNDDLTDAMKNAAKSKYCLNVYPLSKQQNTACRGLMRRGLVIIV